METFMSEVKEFKPQEPASTDGETPNVFLGSHKDQSSKLLAKTWISLHENAKAWISTPLGEIQKKDRKLFDVADTNALSALQSINVNIWQSLCIGTGMTVYGAVALSWCEDAELSQVWEGWEASGFPLKPLPEFERPARFINPALLPTTNSLKEIITIAENKSLPICAMMVAKRDSLEIDLPESMLKSATPQIASFLKAHMERKADRSADENALIEVWNKTVTGTEWEV